MVRAGLVPEGGVERLPLFVSIKEERRIIMTNLLILIERLKFVKEYIRKDIFASAHTREKNSLITANLYVESPYHTYASVICRQRVHWQRMNGR